MNRGFFKDNITEEEIHESFEKLQKYLFKLDPVNLITQLTLTYSFIPDNKLGDDDPELHKNLRHIEFLTGMLACKEYPEDPITDIDGENLEKAEQLLETYLGNIIPHKGFLFDQVDYSSKEKEVLASTRLYSWYVRGKSYPKKEWDAAQSLYSVHDDFFLNNFGFTIREAIKITKSIIEEYNRRFEHYKKKVEIEAEECVENLIQEGEVDPENKEKLLNKTEAGLFFGQSSKILKFTIEDLVNFSGFDKGKCSKFLTRMSQSFGYRNKNFTDAFADPLTAPWDFNTLYERPILSHKNKYFVPLPSMLSEVLLETFYYDLIGSSYWTKKGEEKHGNWLEEKTYNTLKNIFDKDKIFINPYKTNKEKDELSDVLVLHDRKVFIFQCKTKPFRYQSKIGHKFEAIKEDLELGVQKAFSQATETQKYIEGDKFCEMKTDNGRIAIDNEQINKFFLISITLADFQNLITSLANLGSFLDLNQSEKRMWAVSILDLEIIADIIKSPYYFNHYLEKRIDIEKGKFDIKADEIDLLGLYLDQRLLLNSKEIKQGDGISLMGYSDEIDKYFLRKNDPIVETPKKPELKLPEEIKKYIKDIQRLNIPYKTDCIEKILDLSHKGQKDLVKWAQKVKYNVQKEEKVKDSLSFTVDDERLGFSFLALDSQKSEYSLYKQSLFFSKIKKYQTKSREWVGLGWKSGSENLVDNCVYLCFNWSEKEKMESAVEQFLNDGKEIDLS